MSRLARRLARCRRWLLCGRYDLHATVRLLLAIGVVFVMADSLYTYFNRPIETAEVRVGIRNSHGMPEMAEEPDNVPVGENDRRACPVSFPYQGVESVRGKPLFTVVPSRSLMNEELATRMEDHTQSQHILCRKLRERYTTALVFACPHPQCVNLMNGLRGLLLAYVLSVLTNRMFFVRPQQWMPLENYLSPPNDWRSIDWTIEGCSLMQEDLRLKHNVEFNIPYSFLRQSDPDCNKILSVLKNRRRAVAMVTDLDVVCAHKLLATQNFQLDRRKQRSIYNFAFSRLFRFSDKLVEQAARFEIDNAGIRRSRFAFTFAPAASTGSTRRAVAIPTSTTSGTVLVFWRAPWAWIASHMCRGWLWGTMTLCHRSQRSFSPASAPTRGGC